MNSFYFYLESAQHTPKLRIMREHGSYLRPLRSRFVRNPESHNDFIQSLATESPDYCQGVLEAMRLEPSPIAIPWAPTEQLVHPLARQTQCRSADT
jgi:hypothetical protein